MGEIKDMKEAKTKKVESGKKPAFGVNMGANKGETVPMEEFNRLKNITEQLHKQGQALYEENKQLRSEVSALRMNFLFEAIKNSPEFSEEFIKKVVAEIEGSLYPEEQEEDPNADACPPQT
jgi:hypothetical protein